MDLKTLGQRLKELRELAGFSQKDAAEAIGSHRNSIADWERGATEPSVTKVVELLALYRQKRPEISADELFGFGRAGLTTGGYLFDRELHRQAMEVETEAEGQAVIHWAPDLMLLMVRIPAGAEVLPETKAKELAQEALQHLQDVAPAQIEAWRRGRRGDDAKKRKPRKRGT